MKKILGIVAAVTGLILIGISFYIKNQIVEGKAQISEGQRKVDAGNSLFSLHPVTKEVGKGLTGSAQNRIDRGREEIAYYAEVATWLQVGGVILILGGLVIRIKNSRSHF